MRLDYSDVPKLLKAKPPKGLGPRADQLQELDEVRKAAEAVAAALGERANALKDELLAAMRKANTKEISGAHGRATYKTKTIYNVVDWTKLYAFIKKNDAFHLLQKRLAVAAVAERLDDKKPVPGVASGSVLVLDIAKARPAVAEGKPTKGGKK